MSLHSSVSDFLNYAPCDVCVCIIRDEGIAVACPQNGTTVQNALYVQLVPCFVHINCCAFMDFCSYKLTVNNSLPPQLI